MLIESYNNNWPFYFELLKLEIAKALVGQNFGIEHIGSTSIPNLSSKPIIDIDIIYESGFEEIKKSLLKIGYFHNGDQGINGREVFKRDSLIKLNNLDKIPHHLYVCQINSQCLEDHILFRNHLRKNEGPRIKYGEIKIRLAKKANQNKKEYANLKELEANVFVNNIVDKERISNKY